MLLKKGGFTLVELLVVMGVIGILIAILVPRFTSIQTEGKSRQAQADMRTLKTAIELYKTNHGNYPPDSTWDSVLVSEVYRLVDEVPKDPFRSSGQYTYDLDNTNLYYIIYSYGPDGLQGTVTVGGDSVTVSGDGVDNIWTSNCRFNNHNP